MVRSLTKTQLSGAAVARASTYGRVLDENASQLLSDAEVGEYLALMRPLGELTRAEFIRVTFLGQRLVRVSDDDAYRLFLEGRATRDAHKRLVPGLGYLIIEFYRDHDERLSLPAAIYTRAQYRLRLHELACIELGVQPRKHSMDGERVVAPQQTEEEIGAEWDRLQPIWRAERVRRVEAVQTSAKKAA
jgi:hypothetical protein